MKPWPAWLTADPAARALRLAGIDDPDLAYQVVEEAAIREDSGTPRAMAEGLASGGAIGGLAP